MKYQFYLLLNVLSKSFKIMFFYFFCIIIFIIFNLYIQKLGVELNLNLKVLGIIKPESFLEILIYLLNISIYIYICLKIFVYDFKEGNVNIFLRLSNKKYIIYKYLIILIFIVAGKLLTHIVVNILCSSIFSIKVLFSDIMFTLFMVWFLVVLIYFLNKGKFLFCILTILLAFNNELLFINNYNFKILIILNQIIFLSLIYLSKNLFFVYERNDIY